jgi:hypothetical protein
MGVHGLGIRVAALPEVLQDLLFQFAQLHAQKLPMKDQDATDSGTRKTDRQSVFRVCIKSPGRTAQHSLSCMWSVVQPPGCLYHLPLAEWPQSNPVTGVSGVRGFEQPYADDAAVRVP